MLPTLPAISELLSAFKSETSEGDMEQSVTSTCFVTSPPIFPSINWDPIPKLTHWVSSPPDNKVMNVKPGPATPPPAAQELQQVQSPPSEITPSISDADHLKCRGHESLQNVKVELENEDLWKKFHSVGNEMMVTRSGRLMFPVLRLKLIDLLPDDEYKIGISFPFVDEYRYRFSPMNISWKRLFPDDKLGSSAKHERYYEHPSSPEYGKNWTGWTLSFAKVKLSSCSKLEQGNQIYLPTMRKYKINLVVTKLHCSHCETSHTRHINLPLTEFVAVTAYNNHELKKIKIENNPYAKYLRDDNGKNGGTYSVKSDQNGKKTKNTQATRPNKKRKRENVLTELSAEKSSSLHDSDIKIESYWSKSIECSPSNTLPSCKNPSSFIDLTSSNFTLCHNDTSGQLQYDKPYGNEIELSYCMSTEPKICGGIPGTNSGLLPCYYGNNYEQCYSLNYNNYYGCNYDKLY